MSGRPRAAGAGGPCAAGPCGMALPAAMGRSGWGAVVPTVSWPGLARPPTTGGAGPGKDVDGRHAHAPGRAKGPARGAGHDTGVTSPAMLAPFPFAFAHGSGASSVFLRASSPVHVFRRKRDMLS